LGDGHLTKITKKCKNSSFAYGNKIKEHCDYIAEFLKNILSKANEEKSSKINRIDKRTGKEYIMYLIRTILNKSFTELREKWYSDKKHTPYDLILTPLICLIWYIGDGSLNKDGQNIKLSTHCFDKIELEKIILPQLSKFNPHLIKIKNKEQYYIYIPRLNVKDFLNYIGECPIEQLQYKWDFKEYIYKGFENYKNHTSLENEFINLFQQGLTYYAIGKKFNVFPNAVRYYLEKQGLYKRKRKNDEK